jgi:hypothetical protein
MSNLTTKTTYGTDAFNASIVFSVDGVAQTTYTFVNGLVTMSARTNNHFNTIASFNEGVAELLRWSSKIQQLYKPTGSNTTEYETELSYKDKILHHTHYLNQNEVGKIDKKKNILMKASYKTDTKIITFFSRPEIILTFVDFRMAITHTQWFGKQIKNLIL